MINSKLESIPEDMHDLIPQNLSTKERLTWIEKAQTKGLFETRKSDQPIGGQTNPQTDNVSDVS